IAMPTQYEPRLIDPKGCSETLASLLDAVGVFVGREKDGSCVFMVDDPTVAGLDALTQDLELLWTILDRDAVEGHGRRSVADQLGRLVNRTRAIIAIHEQFKNEEVGIVSGAKSLKLRIVPGVDLESERRARLVELVVNVSNAVGELFDVAKTAGMEDVLDFNGWDQATQRSLRALGRDPVETLENAGKEVCS
ncbi:MAG TPA: hypothetical protein VJT73_19820, partial [Polyangiaceae bacterium]|nr:hypothetical protein [Polyangiaceae bacterium]